MSGCITLDPMGKGDNSNPRRTRELTPQQLAALTKQPLPAEPTDEEAAISLGRANTVNDPMTTSLLAEVARRSQTTEFDDDAIQELLDKAGTDHATTSHPNTRRRETK